MHAQCIEAMRETAMFAQTAVARTAARVRPKPRATGQYAQSWGVRNTRNGAVMGNSSRQSIWVERGRRAGKRPPLEPILEWVRVKRLVRTKGSRGKSRGRKRSRPDAAERGLAFTIQAKIGRVGTPARWPLKTAMPAIGKRAERELKRAVRRALESMV